MRDDASTLLPTAVVFATGAFWGVYWLPVRALEDLGFAGAWGTAAIAFAAALALLPAALARPAAFAGRNRIGMAAVALGGAAFALYSIAFLYGRVAIVILLYFLTPVWSVLIGRFVMGWHTTRLRLAAIGVGLAGLGVMLGADGAVPVPRGAGEWMALVAGALWSVASTGMRATSDLAPLEAAFLFALGALATALLLAPFLGPLPDIADAGTLGRAAVIALAAGVIWWALSVAGLMWAAVRLEPVRVGLLLMAEVLVGTASAAILAGERLSPLEWLGGALVLCAGVLEIWPVRHPDPAGSRPPPAGH